MLRGAASQTTSKSDLHHGPILNPTFGSADKSRHEAPEGGVTRSRQLRHERLHGDGLWRERQFRDPFANQRAGRREQF